MSEGDAAPDDCGCGHGKIRHPYGGACNRSGCGCTRYRPKIMASNDSEKVAPVHDITTARDQRAPKTPQSDAAGDEASPRGQGEPVTPAPSSDPPLGEGSASTFETVVDGFEEDDERRRLADRRQATIRAGLASPRRETRALAISICKQIDVLAEAVVKDGRRAEALRELEEHERAAEKLREELGIKKRGRPAAKR